ncbi:urease accessory protein [Rhodopseudomonas julia]|uniref:Urease accessory protein UreD n=1 Tax=Rhodopseudomonas julia TaxID=200617 RepID=A0ABU0C388_9BRAD|nr:urease accessory protein UreD [Rhodopseudomonas julia]MDQ0324414.1 urease accessory protein [Rhodopseudomonas julia]
MSAPASHHVDTDERAAAPARFQRVEAEARIAFKREGGVTRLDRLFHQGSVKWRLPRVPAGVPPEAIVINTAGGFTGGDRFSVMIQMGEGTAAFVMTPACERLYRAAGGVAEIDVHLDLAAGATLYWLPQETIAFEGAACHRRITAELGEGARLVALESTLLGRRAMGERVTRADLRESWRVRRAGRLVHADELALRGDVSELCSVRATLAGGSAFASLLLVAGDCEPLADPLRAALGPAGGASAFNGKILARLVAEDGLALRRRLVPALRILLADCPLPKIWTL